VRELVVVSGKGGTGKTVITAAFAALASDHVIADCDVDAPNLHLLLHPVVRQTEDFVGSKVATISERACTRCEACRTACRFGAITEGFSVDRILCEGCGVCQLVCPSNAVTMEARVSGQVYVSDTEYGPMAHALLHAGEGNSGKLVTQVRKTAEKTAQDRGKTLVLIDGPPGIACPTIAAISGTTAGLVVTEPSVAAIHDLQRVLQLFTHFTIPAMVLINKSDLSRAKSKEIEHYCRQVGVDVVGRIPYASIMTRAVVAAQPIIIHSPNHPLSARIRRLWESTKTRLDSLC
jgi:MinD superfamily P-loop ATPase